VEKTVRALLALVLLLAAAPVHADGEYMLTIGQAIMLGDEGDSLTDGVAISLAWFKRVSQLMLVGAEFGYSGNHVRKGHLSPQDLGDIDTPPDGLNDTMAYTSGLKTKILWFTPQIKLNYEWEETHRFLIPYAVIGGGLYDWRQAGGAAVLTGSTTRGTRFEKVGRDIPKQVDQYFGTNFGGGFTISMTDRFELSADLRYHIIFQGRETVEFLFPGMRMNFLFGGE
jgi:hypothetical protein